MKRLLLILIPVTILLFEFSCCDNECNNCIKSPADQSILGNWIWIRSVGGLGGWTLTPESEGYSQNVIINELYYAELRNDTTILKKQYDFQIKPDAYLGINTYVVLETGFEFTYNLKNDTLVLTEVCYDCFTLTYIRK